MTSYQTRNFVKKNLTAYGTVYLSDHFQMNIPTWERPVWWKSFCLQECCAWGCRMLYGLHSQCQCVGLVPAHQLCGKTSSHQWWAIIAYVNQNDIKPILCSLIRFFPPVLADNSTLSASISVVAHINTDYWGQMVDNKDKTMKVEAVR